MKSIFKDLAFTVLFIVFAQMAFAQKSKRYFDQYDEIKDNGQYWFPEIKKMPAQYWECINVVDNMTHNKLGEKEPLKGLQYHLLCQSIQGLANMALKEGKSKIAVWLGTNSQNSVYTTTHEYLEKSGITLIGKETGIQLATRKYADNVSLRKLFKGYILCDVEKNPESGNVASVASHVFNSIIVDVRDKVIFDNAGYEMMYDATKKSTVDAWREFKDKCNNKALIIMPVQTGELREFAITHQLFVVNLNKVYGDAKSGQNGELLDEILKWLSPNSPVYGWEQGVGEDQFVGKVSRAGHMMVPYDWVHNTTITSLNYSKRQTQALAPVIDPKKIDYTRKRKFVSFYLSDGDNLSFTTGGFEKVYLQQPATITTKIAIALPVCNLPLAAPALFEKMLSQFDVSNTLVDNFGGGYYYANTFDQGKDRKTALEGVARKTAEHCRQHRVKVLGVIAYNDIKSKESLDAYQVYVDANDQLEGIIAIQYSPYAGGKGDIMWCKNKKGIEIPVISVRYSIWNFGTRNNPLEGTPTFIANKLNAQDPASPFSAISIHAWSKFSAQPQSMDELAENTGEKTVFGPGAAELCMNKLDKNTEVVSLHELIWRTRMFYQPQQTKKILNEYE